MPSPSLLPLLFISLVSLSSAHTTTLSLTPSTVLPPQSSSTTNRWQLLNQLATASATRAHHLKHPNKTATMSPTSSTKLPLFPRGYGGYSVSLRLGTPPQTLSFLMDTGSSLVWFPCTRRYSCSSCNFVNVKPANISTFLPKESASSKLVGCTNPKCKWVFPSAACRSCRKNATTCNESCPPYIMQYGSGSTTGLLMSETLNFPKQKVANFVAGCSVFSSSQPAGIAGFGRGLESLPAQMRLKKFSYCLVSHRFDDEPVSSNLVLVSGHAPANSNIGIRYTPFGKNPITRNPAYQDYYYVTLRKITVGGVNVGAPYNYLVADSSGKGGTIVDSGTTFTYMEGPVFERVAREFERQVGKNYPRAAAVEKESSLRPCFNVSGQKSVTLPQLTLHFKGGADMELPLGDYFSFLDDKAICMTIVTNDLAGKGVGPGPAIILGNYQQQNFYIEYDLENERLGFRKQFCK